MLDMYIKKGDKKGKKVAVNVKLNMPLGSGGCA